jgi:TolB-like protein
MLTRPRVIGLLLTVFVALPALGQDVRTLAILPFENNSITDRDTYAPLSKGLSAMLTSDLSGADAGLKLIERSRIEALLKEVALGQSGAIDDSSALEAGRLLGAQNIAFGSYVVLGNMVRIDTRIIKVETGELVMAESTQGGTTDFLTLQQKLAHKIANSLNVAFSETDSSSNISAALAFSQGLDALDAGDREAADRLFAAAVEADPGYQSRVESVLTGGTQEGVATDAGSGAKGNKVVEAEGFSMRSRDEAIEEAQRAAVEQATGVLIQSETEMANFQIQKDRVISRSKGYITSFDVLSSDKLDDGTIIVKIEATVSLDAIQDDLVAMKILLDSMERPSVMVLVEEEYFGMDDLDLALAEAELTSLLDAKGFDLVDQAQVARIRNTEQQRQAMAGNAAAAQALGLDLGAQYVVMGKAVVQDNGEAVAGSGMKSMQSSMQLRILQTQSGLILGSVVETGVASHISPVAGATNALRMSAQKAIDGYVVNEITDAFQDFLNNGAPVKLNVNGVNEFALSQGVISAIEMLEGVVSAKRDGWNRDGGLLMLDLRFRGFGDELAGSLDGLKVGEATLQVTDVRPDRVECQIVGAATSE